MSVELTPEKLLKAAHIPPTFVTLPALDLHPIPHIILPSHPHLCFTNYLVADIPHIVKLTNDPQVSPGLASTKIQTIGIPEITKRIQGSVEEPKGWAFPVIRLVQNLGKEDPGVVGNIAFRPDPRCYHLLGPGRDADELHKLAHNLPDEKLHWSVAFALDPRYFRQGIMKAALRFILNEWFIPHIKPFPGQLDSEYFISNPASEAIHVKTGFLPVALSPYWAGRDLKKGEEEVVCCVWQGSGVCVRDRNIFNSLPPGF